MTAAARTILHVDMDAFYASVEQRDDPALAGRPVIVGGRRDARGVVSAASYEARAFGVHSAMPLRTAGRLCPHGVFLPVRMARYAAVSRAVFAILDRYSPLVEPLSIDEAFLDLTGCERLFPTGAEAARALRSEIAARLGLTASVGVAPNKFVAKIASDLEKPDALVVVAPEAVRAFLAPLPVARMWGIGPRNAEALRRLGIATFAQLAAAPPGALARALGTAAPALQALARGEDARPVVTDRAPKSIGHETTFPEDVTDEAALHATLVALTDKVAGRLRRHGLRARCVTLKVRYAPFQTLTRRCTLSEPVWATRPLLAAAQRLWQRAPRRGAVRLLGVSASGFSAQASLFPEAGEREEAVDRAVDEVRVRFGPAALRRGSVLERGSSR